MLSGQRCRSQCPNPFQFGRLYVVQEKMTPLMKRRVPTKGFCCKERVHTFISNIDVATVSSASLQLGLTD
jgi:hypothetical protein